MREFNEYNQDTNKKRINSGIKIFEKQLNGVEGKDIEIDGVLSKGIILNHLNDMSTTKNQRGLNIHLNSPIKKGSYVKDLDSGETYLVMSRVDSHHTYKTCTMDYCNQTINWKGLDEPIPCYCDNSSYGVKGVIDGTYIAEYDGKIQYFVQYNEKTKEIKQDMRFLFDNNKNSVYKIVDINRVVTGNILRLVMDKVEFNPEKDDLENNIAHNDWLDVVTPEVPVVGEYSIKSSTESMEIHRWDEVTYTVLNPLGIEDDGVWDISVDYNGSPSDCIIVKGQGSNYIKITNDGYVGYEINIVFTKGDISLVEQIRLVR